MTKILIDRAVVEQALEALKGLRLGMPDSVLARSLDQRLDALRAALAEPQEPVQEPVYWEVRCTAHPKWMRVDEQQFDEYVSYGWEGQRLYTTPPQRPAEPEYPLGQASTDVGVPVYVVKKAEPQEPCNKSCAPGYCYCAIRGKK